MFINTMVKEKDNKSKTDISGKKSIFKDERVQFTIGLFTVFLSIYLFISFVSYIFTWKIDQSIEWSSLFGDVLVKNWTGTMGAILSVQFMNKWFGLASIILPAIIFMIGIRMLKLFRGNLLRITFKVILGVVLISLITGFLFGTTNGFLGSGIGGAHGLFVSNLLVSFIGSVGTALILLTALIAYIIYVKPSTLKTFKGLAWDIAQAFTSKPKNTPKPAEKNIGETPVNDNITPQNNVNHNEPESTSSSRVEPKPTVDEVPEPVEPTQTPQPIPSTPIEIEVAPNQPEFNSTKQTLELNSSIELPKDDFELEISNISTPEPEVDITPESTGFEMELEPTKTDNNTQVKGENTDDVEFTIEDVKTEDQAADIDLSEMPLYDPTLELSHYQLPPTELLENYPNKNKSVSEDILIENKNKIIETLQNYKIQIDKIKATIGPTVTLYEIVPAPGIRISKIKNLEDDIALSLAALGIRIIAPIPGKGTIGIEVPNEHPEIVSMHSVIKSQKFQESKYDLAIALGKTISNEIFMLDLAKLPHLLVAGATGQGKSVGLNAIVASLLYKKHPAEIKFVLVDPKKVELTLYSKLEKHFLAKLPDTEEAIITDTQKVVNTLNSLCIEMDLRYDLLKAASAKSIKEYNEKFINRKLNPNKGHRYLPYIVVIIDEFADLIMTAGREVETPIARLAQLARAIGIHLIIATQRPSANIITGIIKANFPARIAFRVSSSIDSRTILDHTGANNLIGRGDMLVSAGSDMTRVQCAFIDTPEIERITDFIGNQQGYSSAFDLPEYVPEGSGEGGPSDIDLKKRDELFEDAARLIVQTQMGSTSQIQRRFSIGYNRAGRIVDQLEAAGIVGPYEGSKARQVLIVDEMSLEQILESISVR